MSEINEAYETVFAEGQAAEAQAATSEVVLNDLLSTAIDLYTAPFNYYCGYIFDANYKMVDDDAGAHVTRVRGWGMIQRMENAEDVQDAVGELIAKAFQTELDRLMKAFKNSDDEPYAITAMSRDHELHRLLLIEEAVEAREFDLLETIFGMINIHNVKSIADIK